MSSSAPWKNTGNCGISLGARPVTRKFSMNCHCCADRVMRPGDAKENERLKQFDVFEDIERPAAARNY